MTNQMIMLCLFAFMSIVLLSCDKYPCLKLPACEQYECRNPGFYCADTLYESGILPKDIQTAQKIVQDYIASTKQSGKIGFVSQSKPPFYWFNVTIDFEDGSAYGYEVGPDGNIYRIKRKK